MSQLMSLLEPASHSPKRDPLDRPSFRKAGATGRGPRPVLGERPGGRLLELPHARGPADAFDKAINMVPYGQR